jgi:hypothetical protein
MATEQSIPATEVEYRPIPGFPGYRVGNDGSVWSCRARSYTPGEFGTGVRYVLGDQWKQMRTRPVGHYGHLSVMLYNAGHGYHRLVHRLVLEAFVGPALPGLEAAHNNGNPADNHLANLRWATKADNQADRVRHGTSSRGESHGQHKLTAVDVVQILDEWANGANYTAIAASRQLSRTTVSRLIRGLTWKHIPRPSIRGS